MDKLLSIIIPTYNMEKYLSKCLHSLVVSDENMQRLEVLVVNDGSKDSSSQIAHEYESKYPKTFRVIDKENGNYGSCINRGLKENSGKYIKVLDADDYFDNDVFDHFISYISKIDVDLVINDYCVFDEQDVIKEKYSFQLPTKGEFTLYDCPDSFSQWIWHHGITYKTEILRKMNYRQTEGISYTDDEWIFKPMIKVRSISYFPEILYYYLRGREGQTFDDKVLQKSMGQKLQVAKSMVEFYVKELNETSQNFPPYLYLKLFNRVFELYNQLITKNTTYEMNEQLKSFDCQLAKSLPKLYEDLGEKKNRIGYGFVKKWREKGYNNWLLMFIYKLYVKYRTITNKNDNVPYMPKEIKRQLS